MGITCMCEKGEICLIHPKKIELVDKSVKDVVPAAGDIEIEDKLQLKTLQAIALDCQLAARDANDRSRRAMEQLNQFAATMFQKYGKDQKTDVLDLSGPKFVSRQPAEG